MEDMFDVNGYMMRRLAGIKSEKLGLIEKKFATMSVSDMISNGMGKLRSEDEIRKMYASRPKKAGVPETFIPVTRVFDVEALVAERDDAEKKKQRAADKKADIDKVNKAYSDLVEALKVDSLALDSPNVKAMFLAFRDMAV